MVVYCYPYTIYDKCCCKKTVLEHLIVAVNEANLIIRHPLPTMHVASYVTT